MVFCPEFVHRQHGGRWLPSLRFAVVGGKACHKCLVTSLRPLWLVSERVDHQKGGSFWATCWLPHWPLRASLATFCLLQNVTSVSSLWFSFCLISKQPLSRPVSLCVYSCRTIKVNFGCFWQRSNTLLESSRSSRYILETSFRQCSLVFKHVPPDQVRGFMVGVAIFE